jgi:hypothetical protein
VRVMDYTNGISSVSLGVYVSFIVFIMTTEWMDINGNECVLDVINEKGKNSFNQSWTKEREFNKVSANSFNDVIKRFHSLTQVYLFFVAPQQVLTILTLSITLPMEFFWNNNIFFFLSLFDTQKRDQSGNWKWKLFQ